MSKGLLGKVLSTWTAPLELHSCPGTHFTGQVFRQVCAVWSVLQHFHRAHHTHSSGLVKCTNSIIKTQLTKFIETFQIPWTEALFLVLLNLRSTPFGTHELSLSEIVTVYLVPASFDLQLVKGEIFQCCKGLNVSIKNNTALVQQSFHSVLLVDQVL